MSYYVYVAYVHNMCHNLSKVTATAAHQQVSKWARMLQQGLKMLITLLEWANSTFSKTTPSIITMRRWATSGKFRPKAQKIGRTYFVDSGAVFIGRSRADIGHTRNEVKNGKQRKS